jgi:hypothetical protein
MRKKSDRPAAPHHSPTKAQPEHFTASAFYAALARALARRGASPAELCDVNDAVERRLLAEYGAMFVADTSVRVPPRCVFWNEEECARFQAEVETRTELIGDARIELQPAALDALLAARTEAHAHDLEITPRGGAEAARRSYADTMRLWESRVTPALAHWVSTNTLAPDEAEHLGGLCCVEQVAAVLEQEERGNFFSKDFSRTILSSVAAPGASQHLAMLAFDAAEFRDERVRAILARHGWFQTVLHDLPHFTFLGVREKELRALGLKRVEECGQDFWIPNI